MLSTLYLVRIELVNRGVPPDISMGITGPIINEVRKLKRQEEQRLLLFNGESRSAMKRRSKFLDRCFRCGKFSHTGKCSKNQTISNMEMSQIIRSGTIRHIAENPDEFRKDSFARLASFRLLERANQTLANLSIKDAC